MAAEVGYNNTSFGVDTVTLSTSEREFYIKKINNISSRWNREYVLGDFVMNSAAIFDIKSLFSHMWEAVFLC